MSALFDREEGGEMVRVLDPEQLSRCPMIGGRVAARFEDRADVEQQFEGFIQAGGLFLSCTAFAKAFSEFELSLSLPGGRACPALSARVVQVVPHGDRPGMMLQFLGSAEALVKTIRDYLQEGGADPGEDQHAVESSNTTSDGAGDAVARHPASGAEILPQDRVGLSKRIKKMLPNERYRLAGRIGKIGRAILMLDVDPQVVFFLLKNPRISRTEVLAISKLPTLNYQAAQLIMGNRQWSQSEELRFNLVMNPRVPMPLVQKLLPTLNMNHIRQIAKNHQIKDQIKRAALRLVVERN